MLFVNIFTEYKSPIISNEYIRTTLASCNPKSDIDFSFVIIDNTLNDDNFTKLSSYHSDEFESLEYKGLEIRKVTLEHLRHNSVVLYVRNDKNNGYGPGGNLGMQVAVEFLSPDYFVISNNDMLCLEDYINFEKVISIFASHSDVGIIGVNVKNLDESKQTPCTYVPFGDRWIIPELCFPFSRGFKKHRTSDLITNPEEGYVYRVRGSFMFIRPEAFLKTGGFDENIFLYGEEPILAERMKRQGYRVYHINDIHMLHNHVMDNRTITNNEIKKLKQRFKSEMYYYQQYCGVSSLKIAIAKGLFPQYYLRYKLFYKMKEAQKN